MAISHNRIVKTSPVNVRSVAATSPGLTRSITTRSRQGIPSLVQSSFLIFAFTIPLQFADLGFANATIGRLSGLLFFAIFCLYYNPIFGSRSFPGPPPATWWFFGHVAVYALNGFFVPEEFFYEFRTVLITLVQLLVLFWCASHLFKEETLAKRFFLTYSIAAGILGLGINLSLPGFSVSEFGGRVTAFDVNPNALAQIMAQSAVVLLGLYLNRAFRQFMMKVLVVLMILTLLIAIVKTGSRGGVLAFMIGCLVYAVPFFKSKHRWTAVLLVSTFTLALVYQVMNTPMLSERVQQSYEGNLSMREAIYPVALEMIFERPLFGWHPIESSHQLGFHIGWWGSSDAHNLFLHLLLEVGLVGAIPFFIGIALCGCAAWRGRSGNLGLLPTALLVTLMAGNMGSTYPYNKMLWLALAVGVASECDVARKSRNLFLVMFKTLPRKNTA